jgi:O-antigen/teichoic acid export membrane protein
VLFGQQWVDLHAVALLQILAVVGITRALTSPVGDLVLAKGRPDVNFRINTFLLVTMAAALFAAVHVGIVAVAITSSVVNTIDFLLFLLVVRWLIGLPLGRYWHALRWPVVNSVLAGAAMVGVRLLLEPRLGNGVLLLLTASVAGVVMYFALAWLYERRYLLQMVALVRPVRVAPPSA